jgi:hypothetical protein
MRTNTQKYQLYGSIIINISIILVMAEEGKKISFGFSKSVKKPVLKNVPPKEQQKVDYIECVDEKSIKIVGYVFQLYAIEYRSLNTHNLNYVIKYFLSFLLYNIILLIHY